MEPTLTILLMTQSILWLVKEQRLLNQETPDKTNLKKKLKIRELITLVVKNIQQVITQKVILKQEVLVVIT
jgi:hypothetical protein